MDEGNENAIASTASPAGSVEGLHVRLAIVGTGFSGLGLAIRLKQQGMRDFVVLERAEDIGGTWRDNTYPGCACDVPSHLYSFSFAPNPHWTRTYSPQREIRAYLKRCARTFNIEEHIRYHTEVTGATWDDADQCWRITTSAGTLTSDMLAMGNGPLSEPSIPNIMGLDTFTGTVFHSANWNHAHDLTRERVAVIGTGASAIQFVPQIQPRVAHLSLYQRTPAWIIPRLDRPIPPRLRALYQTFPLTQRAARARIYFRLEINARGFVYQPKLMKQAEDIALRHLAAQVHDPELRAKLTPSYLIGCKRILLSDDFYPAVTRENVEVVTDSIREVRPNSIVTVDGTERPADTIIFATGFHVSDMPAARLVRGRDGIALTDAWKPSRQAYLGTTVAGFPNLFLLIGPNTGLGHTSMVFMIESQVAYILDCLRTMDRLGIQTIEVREDAQQAFDDELQRRMPGTVWASGCSSWYLDPTGRNTSMWPGHTWEFRRRTRQFDPAAYHLISRHNVGAVVRASGTSERSV